MDLPAPDAATGLVFVALDVDPGHVDGYLEIAGLTLKPPAWKRRAASVAANTRVLPGLDAAQALGGNTLFGFADAPDPALGLGGPEALAAYLDRYPDDVPVAVLSDATGRSRAAYFDPGLRRPLALLGGQPVPVLPGFGEPATARGLMARGRLNGQTVTVGRAAARLPVSGPDGATLLLGADGPGLLHFSPGFDRPLEAVLGEAFLWHAVAAVPGQPALTCAGDAPCFLTYAVNAAPEPGHGGRRPITGFRLAWYPRVLTDNAGRNRITAAYSTDGATYLPLGELRSEGDFFWYGGAMRMARAIRLPRPADRLYVRLALSGGGAQLWSAAETPLSLDVTLTDTGFAGLDLGTEPTPATCDGPPCAVLPTREPPPFGLSLRERL